MTREVHSALERLEAFHADLFRPADAELKHSIEKVVNAFKTGLFSALCDIQDFYDQVLLNDRISFTQKVVEARRFADKWDASGPNVMGRSLRPPIYPPVGFSRPESAFSGSHLGGTTQVVDTVQVTEYERFQVTIDASRSGLGFSISGGTDREQSDITVTDITPGGAVAMDGRVRIGDIIEHVNDVNVTNVPHMRAVQALNDAGSLVRLGLKRERPVRTLSQTQLFDRTSELRPAHRSRSLHQLPVQTAAPVQPLRPSSRLSYGVPQSIPMISEHPRVVFLRKSEAGLGFNIVGGEDRAPIYISSVVPNGTADLSRNVFRGDVLLRVNEISLVGATHSEAVMALKSIPPNSYVELHLQHRPRESAEFFDKIQRASQQHLNQQGFR